MITVHKIDEKELENIKGGAAISIWTGIAIAAIVIFISGIIEGLFRLKWQEHKNIVSTGNSKERLFIQMSREDAIMFIK